MLYKTREEQFSVLIPYIRIGLEKGELCLCITTENKPEDIIQALRSDGARVDEALESGQLQVLTEKETYLASGEFNPAEMLNNIKNTCKLAKAGGYTGFRAAGEASWALQENKFMESGLEYEIKINDVIERNNMIALCQYNLNLFPTEFIKNVIFSHPYVIYRDFKGFSTPAIPVPAY